VLIVLATQGAIGVVGYELIHRVQAVMTVVLTVIFAVFTVKLVSGHEVVSAPTAAGADLAGAFMLEVAIALSLSISWASYASDYSRYLPVDISRTAVFGYTFAGLTAAYVAVQAIGIAAAGVLTDQTAVGISNVMGGSVLGALTLFVIGLGTATSNAMNDYSGSLALQTVGLRMRRPVSAVLVVVLTFALIMWLHAGDLTTRFEGVLLFVSYWVPAFVAIVVIDWRIRSAGRDAINPAQEFTSRADGWAALAVFVVAFAVAVPFMHNNLIDGAVAVRLHGADLAYFVSFLVAAVLYGGYRRAR
jgi:NCS1 family nucleobase:cation symporter-1